MFRSFKKTSLAFFAVLFLFVLNGCVSHLFVDSVSRLQIENGTDDCTILGLDVVSEDGTQYSSWIDETVLPGEKSRVAEEDWVGEFKIRLKYTNSKDGSGNVLEDFKVLDFDGGSLFLTVNKEKGKLTYEFR